jgi:signal recognition particle GTPase
MIRSILAVLLLSGSAIAQVAAPAATKPATKPTTVPADASTPRGALRLLFTATDAGDEAAIRARLYTTNPLEEKIAEATARSSSASAALYRAMVGAFGAEQTHTYLPDPALAARGRDQRVQYLVETINEDGQSAVVRMEGMAAVEPFEFRKVGNEWKLRVGKKMESTTANEIEQQMIMVDLQLKVLSEVTADISAGKLKSVADVKQTMEAKVRQANMEFIQAVQKRATTRAATQPAN